MTHFVLRCQSRYILSKIKTYGVMFFDFGGMFNRNYVK
jgi:hypothetical protein